MTHALRTYRGFEDRPRLEVGVYRCPRCGAEVEVFAPTITIRCPRCHEGLALSTRVVTVP